MKDETEIVTETTNLPRFFITVVSVSMGGVFLFGSIAAMFRVPIIGLIGLVLFAITPVFLLKKIMLFFTKCLKILFFEDYFSLLIMNLNTGVVVSENQFFYKDIQSCTITSAQVKTSSICLDLGNIGKRRYIFNNIKGADTGNVAEIIYNNIKIRKPDIILIPAFFGSDIGRFYIIGMAILLTFLLFLHIYYFPRTSPFTFLISISFYINILVQRKNDIDGVRRLSNE